MGDAAIPLDPWAQEVASSRRGDRASFERIVRGTQRQVYGLCYRMLGSPSEAAELAQETYLRAYQNLGRYDPRRSFEVWLLSIARNLAIDVLRRRRHAPAADFEDALPRLADGAPRPDEAHAAAQENAALEQALATLGAEDREVLSLYYVQRRTTKEIADIQGVAPGTVMARLFRAREKLRKRLSSTPLDRGTDA